MPDVFTKAKRSRVMSRIRGRGNKATELAMVALFRRHHITGWRRRFRLFGNPDFVFPERHLALFVDGCFWHSCPKHATKPVNNRAFWKRKLAANKGRDRLVVRSLKQRGWSVLRVWQHELARKNETRLLRRLNTALGLPRNVPCHFAGENQPLSCGSKSPTPRPISSYQFLQCLQEV